MRHTPAATRMDAAAEILVHRPHPRRSSRNLALRQEMEPSQETPPPHATLGLTASPTLHPLRPDRERLPMLHAKALGRYTQALPASDDDEDSDSSGDIRKREWHDGEDQARNSKEGEIIEGAASDIDHASSPSVATSTASTKNSRYLREIDRRTILERLGNGEKQAELAREFNVSRAAICNLNKHRDDVMARAHAGNPYAKHPKKPRASSTASSKKKTRARNRHRGASPPIVAAAAGVASSTLQSKGRPLSVPHSDPAPSTEKYVASSQPRPSRLHSAQQLCSRSVAMLLTKVHDRNTAPHEFQRVTNRLIHALVEEALSRVPIKYVQVQVSDHEWVNGLLGAKHTCAISMERTLCPVLDTFHLLEPQCPSGYLRVIQATNHNRVPVMAHILDAHLPSSLLQHTVLLLDLVSSSSDLVCAAIQKLLDHGAMECQITLVTVFALSDVITTMYSQFPSVCILTTEIVTARRINGNNGNENADDRAAVFLARYEHIMNK